MCLAPSWKSLEAIIVSSLWFEGIFEFLDENLSTVAVRGSTGAVPGNGRGVDCLLLSFARRSTIHGTTDGVDLASTRYN